MINPDTYLIAGAVAVALLGGMGLLALWHDNSNAAGNSLGSGRKRPLEQLQKRSSKDRRAAQA
jgi:predicted ribosomally synthesized peptide with SipW-like signal peptide